MITADTITNHQIRELRRADHTLLDTLMVALHSTDLELHQCARARCAEILNTRNAGQETP